jgi:hypothetical protein
MDMYWAYETSTLGLFFTVIFAVFGLIFLSSSISAPPGAPVSEDIKFGVLFLILAPVITPLIMVFWAVKGVRSSARRGMHVHLSIGADGLDGWAVPIFREATWSKLRHPRMESRVLVLPFSWPWADSWAIIPVRAFTPHQLDELLAILRAQGFFLDGDHRSVMGRLMGLVLDHGPVQAGSRAEPLKRFARLGKVPHGGQRKDEW